jgi:cysteine desulfurase family protein (TIGR01976 family)
MFELSAIRDRFPALARTGDDGRPLVIVDAPGGSQVPDTVIEAVSSRFRAGVSNLDGAFTTSREIAEVVAAARLAGADLVGTGPERIVFGQNSTSLLFHVARSLTRAIGPGDEIVVTRLDHDANVRPWALAARDAGATLRWVDIDPADATLDDHSFEAALSDRTRLVAFTLASNGVGTITPAARLVRRAKETGALVAIDGVHLAQHRSIGFDDLGADLLAVSPYKVFGPHLGMLAARPGILDDLDPYRVRPAQDYPSPERWETGTQNHEAMLGFVAAVDYLADAGRTYGAPDDTTRRAAVRAAFAVFAEHEGALSRRFLEGLARIPGTRLWGIGATDRIDERTPTFAVRLGDQDPRKTAEALGDRGIFVWDGHYYAMELFERLGLLETGGAVRIGFCHYHTADEVDRVLSALDDLA